jgi:glutamate-ammonia-ligase adenylyltransferase
VFEGLRQLHRKIRDEAQRRAAGRPERANDVKLSRGGIREIEFIVQLMLVVRGGQFPEIRTRSTLRAPAAAGRARLMKADTAAQLAEAYTSCAASSTASSTWTTSRPTCCPPSTKTWRWIARSLGLACSAEACELLDRLGEVRELVAPSSTPCCTTARRPRPATATAAAAAPAARAAAGGQREPSRALPPELAARLRPLGAAAARAGAARREPLRLGRLMQRPRRRARRRCTKSAALRFVDWVEPLLRRESYLALLVERPEVQRRLLRLLGLARWPMQYLMRHPGVIDELADERLLHLRFDRAAFSAELEERHAAWERSGEADEESCSTRCAARTMPRCSARWCATSRRLTVEEVADDLSALADAVLERTLRWAWKRLKQRHRDEPGLAVIAYGKLGGKELGYGSDLDVVFLYDDSDEADKPRAGGLRRLRAQAHHLADAAHRGRRAVRHRHRAAAQRQFGAAGHLDRPVRAYQAGRGSNTAWTWEHQALTRARFAAGAAAWRPLRGHAPRRADRAARPAALREEVRAMRDKVRGARPVPTAASTSSTAPAA